MLIFAAGCSQEEDVAPMATQGIDESTSISQDARNAKSQGLQDIKVASVLEDGSTFAGEIDITSLSYDPVKGLLANGEIKGTSTTTRGKKTEIRQAFSNIEATLANGDAAAGEITAAATCQILFLDLGPIFLDVLGLQVDLSQIVLDITAVSGGGLLGDLLCAVANLLNPLSGLLNLLEDLGALLDLLEQINDLLG